MYILDPTEGRGIPKEETLILNNRRDVINAWKTVESMNHPHPCGEHCVLFQWNDVLWIRMEHEDQRR